MSYSISDLLIRNLRDVFGENDPARRRAAIDELWAEDGVFYDPSKGAIRGRDAIDRIAGAVKATHPDFRYQVTAAPQEYCDAQMQHGIGRATRCCHTSDDIFKRLTCQYIAGLHSVCRRSMMSGRSAWLPHPSWVSGGNARGAHRGKTNELQAIARLRR